MSCAETDSVICQCHRRLVSPLLSLSVILSHIQGLSVATRGGALTPTNHRFQSHLRDPSGSVGLWLATPAMFTLNYEFILARIAQDVVYTYTDAGYNPEHPASGRDFLGCI